MLTCPPILKAGDHIAIIAPASRIEKSYIDAAEKVFKSWELNVITGKHLFDSHFKFAGKDPDRLSDIQAMLNSSDVKAIICARGGYGFNRVMDQIDYTAFNASPKWIIGFSDITAWHCQLSNLGFQSIHAIMPSYFEKKKVDIGLESLRNTLFGRAQDIVVSAHMENRFGSVNGIITGGNLALLCSMIGTNSDINTNGKILFLEDVGETLYNIDRMMIHLKRAGKLDHLLACIIGKFTESKETPEEFGNDEISIIKEHFKSYEYPLCFDFPAGHIPNSFALPFGRNVKLQISSELVQLNIPGDGHSQGSS
ncbi:MAG: LD-carboxypeptidase [Cyclobacteriaceae bacterium]|nr:LD-carboxypeptidase [Cyclobacteriaceae bacterium]